MPFLSWFYLKKLTLDLVFSNSPDIQGDDGAV